MRVRITTFKAALWGAAGSVMAVLIGVGLMAPQPLLEVRRVGMSGPLISLESGRGMQFSVQFLHSYDRAFFQEHYRLEEPGRIILSHMRFKSCLNGQGFELGTYRPLPDGSAELSNINKELEEITFRFCDVLLAINSERYKKESGLVVMLIVPVDDRDRPLRAVEALAEDVGHDRSGRSGSEDDEIAHECLPENPAEE